MMSIYTSYIEDIYNDEYTYYLYWGYLQWWVNILLILRIFTMMSIYTTYKEEYLQWRVYILLH